VWKVLEEAVLTLYRFYIEDIRHYQPVGKLIVTLEDDGYIDRPLADALHQLVQR
jgi:hypothetical protein